MVRTPERVSETTVQVPGINEPDIVKTEGKNIYFYVEKLDYSHLPSITKIIQSFPPENLSLKAVIDKGGLLFLKNNILIIFNKDEILGYDASKADSPEEKWEVKFEDNGELVGARLFKDKIYFVTKNEINPSQPCPINSLNIQGKPFTVKCTQIYHPLNIVPVDVIYNVFILNPSLGNIEKSVSFVGSSGSSIVYMSKNNIYITYDILLKLFNFYYEFYTQELQDLLPKEVILKIKKLKDDNISNRAKVFELITILDKYISSLDSEKARQIDEEEERMKKFLEKKKKRSI